jgi:serine phosphatase RsbU (regulator of sigma subunit)
MVRIREAFPESFIFFRPRDIVSGDFYWLHTEGDYKMIAAVDCTGHGVPGAFMSVIGSTLLSQIVEEQNVTDPGEILGRLNREVKRRLNQNAPDAKTNDGMDAALCVIKGNTVLFAGANRPLFVVSSNGVLTEVAGAKAPIGGRFSLQDQVYTTHEIEFNAGDSLYLTSDGYADQFGGPERRKFMNKRLKELLTAISRLPAETQYICIAETMDSWQGSNRQLDDILVIGIKG